MYEPVVLQKRKPRSITGTPASILSMIGAVTVICVPLIGLHFFSNFIIKKKKLIAELNEYDINNRQMTVLDEYQQTKSFWQQSVLRGAAQLALKKLREDEFNTSVEPSSSDSDIPKANN